MAHSEVLSIHCPATPQTTGLLNAERINHLPDGAIVVNTARGAIVDDDALIDALTSGKLWAAGLDVFNGEPRDIHPQYRQLDNVFLLPISVAPPMKPGMQWGFVRWITWTLFLAGRHRVTD